MRKYIILIYTSYYKMLNYKTNQNFFCSINGYELLFLFLFYIVLDI